MKRHLTRTFGGWDGTHARFDFDFNEIPRPQVRGGREGNYAWFNIAIGTRYGDDLISVECGFRRPLPPPPRTPSASLADSQVGGEGFSGRRVGRAVRGNRARGAQRRAR